MPSKIIKSKMAELTEPERIMGTRLLEKVMEKERERLSTKFQSDRRK